MSLLYKIENNSVVDVVEEFNDKCIECNKCSCLMMNELNIEMKSFTKQILTDGFTKQQAYSCVDCNQCNEYCDLDVNEIFMSIRKDLYSQFSKNKIFNTPYLLQKQVNLNIKNPKPKSRIVFMPGCTLNKHPELVNKTLEILKTFDKNIELYNGCCSKPIKMLGDGVMHDKYLKQYQEDFKDTLIITACFSCTKILKDHTNTIMLFKYMLDNNLVEKKHNSDYTVKLPCHLDEEYITLCNDFCSSLGINVISTDNICCGSGGLIALSNHKLSKKYLNSSINNLNSEKIVCFCSECNSKISKKTNSIHITKLL